jgi:hypothetical protein
MDCNYGPLFLVPHSAILSDIKGGWNRGRLATMSNPPNPPPKHPQRPHRSELIAVINLIQGTSYCIVFCADPSKPLLQQSSFSPSSVYATRLP